MTSRKVSRVHSTTALGAIALATLVGAAGAENLPFPPPQAQICTSNVVDRDKLADYLLRKYPLSVLAVPPGNFSSRRQLLAILLKARDTCTKKCGPSDQQYLDAIRGNMDQVLAGSLRTSFDPNDAVDVAEYFDGATDAHPITCVVSKEGVPIEAPGALFVPPPKTSSNFRIRGNPNQLNVDRASQQEFAATDKATLSFVDNHIAESKTTKILGDIGYAVPIPPLDLAVGNRLDVVPYLGINRNEVTVSQGSTTKPSKTSTGDVGVLASAYVTTVNDGSILGHQFNVRPDFLADFVNNSRLLTLNLEYIPVRNSVINSFRPMNPGQDFASIKVIFSLKDDNGVYTNRGNESVANSHRDYVRLGAQVGFAIVSDDVRVPLDFSTTYTGLGSVSGGTHINYLQSSLNYSFDPNKYIGLAITYSHGNREDTGKKENQWQIGLTGRY